MAELKSEAKPGDSDLYRIWKDVLTSEADQIRKSKSKVFIDGKRVELPADAYRPSNFLQAKLHDDRATYVVSIMLQRPPNCDSGANGANATIEPDKCPARLTVIPKDGGAVTTTEMPGACGFFLWGYPEPKPNAGTFVRLDADAVEVTAVLNDVTVAGCDLRFPIR